MSLYWVILSFLFVVVMLYLYMFYKLNKERSELREIRKLYIEMINKIIHESGEETE